MHDKTIDINNVWKHVARAKGMCAKKYRIYAEGLL